MADKVSRKDDAARDCLLVVAAQKGDTDAFRQLVELYQDRMYRLVVQIVRNEEDAKDVAQEVFVKLYLSIKDFRNNSSFFTWAYRIAFNLAIDWKRKYGRFHAKTDSQQSADNEETVAQIPSTDALPDDLLFQQEQRIAINEALSKMTDEQRSIVVLREVDGLSYDEISETTGLPKGTVMSRLFYGRQKLSELLAKFRMKDEPATSNMQETDLQAFNKDEHRRQSLPHNMSKGALTLVKSVVGS